MRRSVFNAPDIDYPCVRNSSFKRRRDIRELSVGGGIRHAVNMWLPRPGTSKDIF